MGAIIRLLIVPAVHFSSTSDLIGFQRNLQSVAGMCLNPKLMESINPFKSFVFPCSVRSSAVSNRVLYSSLTDLPAS